MRWAKVGAVWCRCPSDVVARRHLKGEMLQNKRGSSLVRLLLSSCMGLEEDSFGVKSDGGIGTREERSFKFAPLLLGPYPCLERAHQSPPRESISLLCH